MGEGERDLVDAVPLYLASLIVTLTAVGAVGVSIPQAAWSPIWVGITVVGHALSLLLRRLRLPAESVFYPVMAIGSVVLIQLCLVGSPLLGLDQPLSQMPIDMATAVLIATLSVLRTFTLTTNASLLFSSVPAITMLALVGSSNPNAEVPLFFGVLILSSLLLTTYEAHLRRVRLTGQAPLPILFLLLPTCSVPLLMAFVALLFPFLVQTVIGP